MQLLRSWGTWMVMYQCLSSNWETPPSGFHDYGFWLQLLSSGSLLFFYGWLIPTRLETRTEESGVWASRIDPKSSLQNESESHYIKICVPTLYQFGLNEPYCFGSSESSYTRTRKIVNYSWIDWSQRKLWWKISNSADVQIACQS